MAQYSSIQNMKSTSEPVTVSSSLTGDVYTEEGKRLLTDYALTELRRDQKRLDMELA